MTELDGATSVGDIRAWPSSPGEFAARWNAQDEEWRRGAMERILINAQIAQRCILEDRAAHD